MNLTHDQITTHIVRPRPQPGESYEGYLIRIAEANLYASAYYVTNNYKGSYHSARVCLTDKSALTDQRQRLAYELQLPIEELEQRWPIIALDEKQVTQMPFGRLTLHRDQILFGASHLCPDCLKEDGFSQELWEVRAYTACHRHLRLMMSHCPICGRRPSIQRGRLHYCHYCESEFPTETTATVAPEETQLAAALAQGYMEGDHACRNLSTYAPLFDGGLVNGLEILRYTVRMLQSVRTPWLGNRRATAEERHRTLLASLALFESWPDKWHAHLAKRIGTDVLNELGIRQLFRRELRELARHDETLGFMHEALVDWFMTHHPGAASVPSMRGVVGNTTDRATLMTIDEAADRLDASRNTVLKWAEHGHFIIKHERVGADERLFLVRDAVDDFRVARENALTFKHAARVLGVSPRAVNRIVDAGLLQAIDGTLAGTSRYISRDAIESFWVKLEAHVVGPRGYVISTTAALAMMAPVWSSIVPLLEAVVRSELPLASVDRVGGLLSLGISKGYLTQILAATDNRGHHDWITAGEAAALFQVSRNQVYWLLEKRVLSSEDYMKYGPQPRCKLDISECHGFHRRYASLNGLAKQYGCSRPTVKRWLRWANIGSTRLGAGHTTWNIFEREPAELLMERRTSHSNKRVSQQQKPVKYFLK